MSTRTVAPQIDRLVAEIDALSRFSDAPAPAVTRILYTEMDMTARGYVRELAETAGFEWRTDAVGNMFICWQGSRPELAPVATGSHMDAVPFSGKYDGVVGVLGGLEAMRVLRASGFQPKRSIELIIFTAEEPTRFGLGCIGSRVLSGSIKPDKLSQLKDAGGVDFDTARRTAGFDGDLCTARLSKEHYAAFVELHIEQGPVLETEKYPIGVVTGIAASTTAQLTLQGNGGHAGTVPMDLRHDPFLAAAEVALGAERVALELGRDAVATIGECTMHPGASNSIPREVKLSLDIRHVDENRRDAMVNKVKALAHTEAAARGLAYRFNVINADPALPCAPQIVRTIENATNTLDIPAMRLVSRAYHDTVFMGTLCPVGMIFIPCRNGYSHRPEEYATPEHIAAGVQVLAISLASLSKVS